MRPRAVIAVGIAAYPLSAAGNTWAFLQWALAFRKAGWDVHVVETVRPDKCIDEKWQPVPFHGSANEKHWKRTLSEFGLEGTLLMEGESSRRGELDDFASGADLLLNISGHFRDRKVLDLVKCRIYLDLDPAFTQIWSGVYNSDMNLEGHDRYFTVGPLLGTPDCRAPLLGKEWEGTFPPVMLEHWSSDTAPKPGAPFTTMTHWYGYPPVQYEGEWYGNKSEEFEKILNLPTSVSVPLEIATDLKPEHEEYKRFSGAGWWLVLASPLNDPWQRYREYLAGSRGEFCVAKNGYVRSNCGWFSDRSVCYLSLGRPVILQETGWSRLLPAGEGLLPFTDMAGAAQALETVASDWEKHSRAARRLAEEWFEGEVVVKRLLEKL